LIELPKSRTMSKRVFVSERFRPAKGIESVTKISNSLQGQTFVVEPVDKELKSRIELLVAKHGGTVIQNVQNNGKTSFYIETGCRIKARGVLERRECPIVSSKWIIEQEDEITIRLPRKSEFLESFLEMDIRQEEYKLAKKLDLLNRTSFEANPAPGPGDDDEEDDEEKKRIMKSKKPKVIAKTSVLFNIKPWDDETDMKAMEEAIKTIKIEGSEWGATKLVPVDYGIKKLQIMCSVEDEKVSISIEELSEKMKELDFVMSVEAASMNKI